MTSTSLKRLSFALPLLFALGGCSILGKQKEPTTLYAPDPRMQADPSWPGVDWQLSISNCVNAPLPQPTSSHRQAGGGASQARNASPTRWLHLPM